MERPPDGLGTRSCCCAANAYTTGFAAQRDRRNVHGGRLNQRRCEQADDSVLATPAASSTLTEPASSPTLSTLATRLEEISVSLAALPESERAEAHTMLMNLAAGQTTRSAHSCG